MAAKSKRNVTYTRIIALPPPPNDFVAALRESIAVNGVLVPIMVDEDRRIIDGTLRKQIANELEYDCPEQVVPRLTLEEKRTLARCVNLARRHLTDEQRRELIADQIQETPNRSDRWIARQLGVSHPTVGFVRRQVEGVYHLDGPAIGATSGAGRQILSGETAPHAPAFGRTTE